MDAAPDGRFWDGAADPQCPLSRRVLEGKRTCYGDCGNDVHDPKPTCPPPVHQNLSAGIRLKGGGYDRMQCHRWLRTPKAIVDLLQREISAIVNAPGGRAEDSIRSLRTPKRASEARPCH